MATGSEALDQIVVAWYTQGIRKRPLREYVLWLARKLDPLPGGVPSGLVNVRGWRSQVFVVGQLQEGRSTAGGFRRLITRDCWRC